MPTRARSFWGWGYDDKFPSDEARQALASRIGKVFGTTPPLRSLPKIEDIVLPAPRYTPPLELKGFATADTRERASHTYGRGYRDLVRGFAGDFSAAPDWVFYPPDEDAIVGLFRFCEAESIALVPYGGGTNVVGATEHHPEGRFRGTACVDLSKMDQVLAVDATSRAARTANSICPPVRPSPTCSTASMPTIPGYRGGTRRCSRQSAWNLRSAASR